MPLIPVEESEREDMLGCMKLGGGREGGGGGGASTDQHPWIPSRTCLDATGSTPPAYFEESVLIHMVMVSTSRLSVGNLMT